MLLSVCIATYRRPELLARLLTSLAQQKLVNGIELEIVIVDND
jgi:glycosyltransferase involved in cell wall biosynthesis